MKTTSCKTKSVPAAVIICILLLQLCLFMHGCSGSAGSRVPYDGRALYASKCGSCHRLLAPQEYSMDEWLHYVDKYGKRMTEDQKQMVLSYIQQERIDPNPD
jgi:mono/diheme cytochrome c family protein